jgi:RND family efflux transporter MFP subunit
MRTTTVALGALALLPVAVFAQEYDCLIEARQMVEIRSPVEGLVESITVDRGDSVRKGQVLVVLESGPERAALEIAKSRATMTGPVEAAQARVEFAKTKEKRQEELYRQNFVSSSALDEARTERRLAESELRVALENQKLAELDVARTQELLAMRSIRSPFSGVVVDRLMDPGEFATTNLREPILKLAETDPLNVEVVLPATLFGKVKKGDRGDILAETGARTTASVSVVDRVIDGASGTFGVRLELRNPGNQIPAGAKCRLRLAK